jgi:hypothetical protein
MGTSTRVALFACGVFAACQSYDFAYIPPSSLSQTTQTRTIKPITRKPNIMLLVDKSGSMDEGLDGVKGTLPSKLTVLRETMNKFLTDNGKRARIGLTFFPQTDDSAMNTSCKPADRIATALPATGVETDSVLQSNAATVIAKIQSTPAKGGTPTSRSLAYVGSLPELKDAADPRDNFVLLLTDGLPNCNDALRPQVCNGSNALSPLQCVSTTPNGTMDWAKPYCEATAGTANNQCLDRDGVVEEVKKLRANEIRTIVVGFGSGTAGGNAAETLNAAALAGGFTRQCVNGTDAECGAGNSCDKARKVCSVQFFQASNANDLSDALAKIYDGIVVGDPCKYPLESQPSDPRLLAVLINGENTPPGADTWQYTAGVIQFQGALCTKVKTPQMTELKVELRILERF